MCWERIMIVHRDVDCANPTILFAEDYFHQQGSIGTATHFSACFPPRILSCCTIIYTVRTAVTNKQTN